MLRLCFMFLRPRATSTFFRFLSLSESLDHQFSYAFFASVLTSFWVREVVGENEFGKMVEDFFTD